MHVLNECSDRTCLSLCVYGKSLYIFKIKRSITIPPQAQTLSSLPIYNHLWNEVLQCSPWFFFTSTDQLAIKSGKAWKRGSPSLFLLYNTSGNQIERQIWQGHLLHSITQQIKPKFIHKNQRKLSKNICDCWLSGRNDTMSQYII